MDAIRSCLCFSASDVLMILPSGGIHIWVMADLSKKRKFLSVELDLPEAKHKCLESECDDTMDAQEEIEAFGSDSMHSLHMSQVESAKDSNSFLDEADTAVSGFAEVGWEHDHPMGMDRASTSSAKWPGCDYLQEIVDASDVEKGLKSESGDRRSYPLFNSRSESPQECGLRMRQMLEEQLLEFGVDLSLGCSEYANECKGQLVNKEEGSIYMLSGKSNVTEEPLNGPKKPTIDREFEDYFSTLMM